MLLVNHLTGFGVGGGAAFSPLDITGLQFWVKSDAGITKDGSNFVSQWDDQSGNSRNLTEATNKPLWVDSLINGKPAIRFDGSNDQLSTGAFDIAQPATAFLVLKILTHTSGRGFLAGQNGVTCMFVLRGSPLVHVSDTNVGDGASVSDNGTFGLFKGVFNGTSSVIALDDGSDQTSATNFTSVAFNDGLRVGRRESTGFCNCEIAEILIYNSAITGANLTNVKSYLNSRYSLW